jgi:rhodanese-related sulfurtransferase
VAHHRASISRVCVTGTVDTKLTSRGLLNYLEKRKAAGTLSELAGPEGQVKCVFICCDLPYQYIDEYFDKVSEEEFRPIQNLVGAPPCFTTCPDSLQNLAAVDLHRYDEAWELQPTEAVSHFWQSVLTDQPTVLIDLRKPGDFIASQIPSSYNLPLQSLNASTTSPFFDAAVLEKQWKELDAMFSQNTLNAYDLAGKKIGVLCYDGDTARVATSVLRAKGIAASSIKGGFQALAAQLTDLLTAGPSSLEQWSKVADAAIQEVATDDFSPEFGTPSVVLVGAL